VSPQTHFRFHGVRRVTALLLGLLALSAAGIPAAAGAATSAAGWTLNSQAMPTNFSTVANTNCQIAAYQNIVSGPDVCNEYEVTATNSGSQPTDGSTITLTDTLPSGVTLATPTNAFPGGDPIVFLRSTDGENIGPSSCTGSGQTVECQVSEPFPPDTILVLDIFTFVNSGETGDLVNTASISGGGAPAATASSTNPISDSSPPFGLSGFSALAAGLDGQPATQAGAHPYEFTNRFDLNNLTGQDPFSGLFTQTTAEDPKDVVVDLPIGFLGSAQAAPTCTFAQLAYQNENGVGLSACPPNSRVGTLFAEAFYSVGFNAPIYNMVPEQGVAAEFGYQDILASTHVITARVVPSPSGYVVQASSPDVPQVGLTNINVTFFGNPAARSGTGNTPTATFTNSSSCTGQPVTTTAYLDSWQHPGTFSPDGTPDLEGPGWIIDVAQSPPVTGCEALSFQPTVSAAPESSQADSPSGLDVNISLPQPTSPGTLATPPLKRAVVSLPPGLTVNPSSANGLAGCSLAQVGISPAGQPDGAEPTCPDASKLGTVSLETPLLPGTLGGSIYLARQSENPFGSLLAIYIVVDDPATGTLVKIPAEIQPNPANGQLTAIVDNSPQFPFSELRTHFFGGALASLRTPTTCGHYEVATQLTPWSAPQSGPPSTPSSSFQISSGPSGSGCASTEAGLPNSPSFEAGTATPIAGAYSPFVLRLARPDGSQLFSHIDATLPEGLLGKLAGITYCPEPAIGAAEGRGGLGQGAAEIASPSCPAASEVGTVNVGAGAGSRPFYATGHAYLAGPYKGAPLSLVVITPAVAGPFDLGSVVVRNALYVNETNAQIHAVSDPFPTILHGIPLDIRSIALNMNRPNFTFNPTSCEPKQITGSATSTLGTLAPLQQRFQVGACGALGFKPSLKLSLKGATKRSGVPALKAVLTYPKGSYANIKSISTVLPKSEFIDNAHIGNTCTRVQFNAGAGQGAECPKRSALGHAIAYSPLLDKPLEGTVYLRSNGGERELPDLVVALKGQINVTLLGFIDSVKKNKHSEVSRLRTRFMNVPDAPVSRFVLQLAGAKHGLLQNSENLCRRTQLATVKATGQNGKVYDTEPVIQNSCGKKPKKQTGKTGRAR
jgi:hypothetical protein